MDSYRKLKSGLLVPKSFSGMYPATRPSRKRRWLQQIQTDSRDVLSSHVLRSLRSSARQLYAQSGLVRGAFRDVARYMIGHDGIRPQSLCSDQGWAQEAVMRWLNWLKIADVRRKLHMNQIVRASSIEMDTDGDFGIILTETGGGSMEAPGMAQIQTMRAHRIDDDGGDENCIAGVVSDRDERTVAYRVRIRESKYRDIPVSSFVLLGDPELSDWDRFPSAIAHGITTMVDSQEVMDAVTVGVKSRTSKAIVIQTPDGTVDEDDLYDNEEEPSGDPDRLTLEEIQSGEIVRLGPGEEIKDISMDFPGQHVIPLMEFSYRDFALGYGVPLEVIYKGDLGSASQRFLLSKFQRRVDERRSMVLIPHLYYRLWSYFIAKEMKRKALRYHEDWWKVRFVPTSPKITIDVGREAQQNREDILLGTRTIDEDASERGMDWREIREQGHREADDLITRAKDLAAKHDIEFAIALSILSRRSPNGNLPTGPVESKPTSPVD